MVVEPIDPFQGCVLNGIDVTPWNALADDLGLKQPDDYPDQGVVVLTFPSMTETDPMLNPVAGVSERAEGKSKRREGFRKPNSEPSPNRTAEIATGDYTKSTAGVIADDFSDRETY